MLPDDWNTNTFELFGYDGSHGTSYDNNIISDFDWFVLESNGAVFLPSAGSRYYKSIGGLYFPIGYYWTSSYGIYDYNGGSEANAHFVSLPCAGEGVSYQMTLRCSGHSVRLVQDANK